jgi:hypothetical protein
MTVALPKSANMAPKSRGPFFLTIPSVATAMVEVASSANGQPYFEFTSDYPGNWDMWFGRFHLVIDPPETAWGLGDCLRLLTFAALLAWAAV